MIQVVKCCLGSVKPRVLTPVLLNECERETEREREREREREIQNAVHTFVRR
jgi:hypothetical protein